MVEDFYKEILKKYILLVKDHESFDFLEGIGDGWHKNRFSKEEEYAIIEVVKEAREEW